VCALRRREILIFALRTGGGVLTGMHVIFNYVTNVAAVGNADKFTEILLKFFIRRIIRILSRRFLLTSPVSVNL